MEDLAHKETDQMIEDLEKKIKKEYERAQKDIDKKAKEYFDKFQKEDAKKKEELSDEAYQKWRTQKILVSDRFNGLRDNIADDLLNARKISESYVKDNSLDVFALNHNYETFRIEKDTRIDTSYTLYNKDTVMRLLKDNPDILPAPQGRVAQDLKDGKIVRWNKQKITSEVVQSILQGESVNKMAKRMRNVTNMDYHSSIRNARTATTGAENAGRQHAMERAKDMGINRKKCWIANMDGRTRHWHVETDGQIVEIDEPFSNEYGDIMYPGDSGADPANVYNCRCTMISVRAGKEDEHREWSESRHNDVLGDMTYNQWKKEHSDKQKKKKEKKEVT